MTRCVCDVRLALGDSEQRVIKTVLKRGYMFIAPISRPGAGARKEQVHALSLSAEAISLVVLPFANLSGDVTQDYLGDRWLDDIFVADSP